MKLTKQICKFLLQNLRIRESGIVRFIERYESAVESSTTYQQFSQTEPNLKSRIDRVERRMSELLSEATEGRITSWRIEELYGTLSGAPRMRGISLEDLNLG